MYVKTSIPKSSEGAGVAVPKDPNVIVMLAKDITAEPTREHGSVVLSGNYTLANGAKAIGIYLTPGTIDVGFDTEGDVDAKGFKQTVAGSHPGNDTPLQNFIEGTINEGVVILVKDCNGGSGEVKAYGSKCNPLFLSPESTDNKEANRTQLSWQQDVAQAFLPGIYTGTMPDLADDPEDADGSGSGDGA